ncbi:alanine racemase [Parablastomonas sp. CN1-191]|uniref:alanine racemase n=1 Tax=Parablastomonas sp. CN1-191 TaxID=3400908 RepID=UPI003BF8FB57
MPPTPDLPLRLALDEGALVANWRALNRLSGDAAAGAAVKADAYGLGAVRAVRALAAAGCADVFVAWAGEAEPLLGLIEPSRIAVLHGPRDEGEARWIAAAGLRPVINTPSQARSWIAVGGGLCDVMVDTGINRIGLGLADLGDDAVRALKVDVLHSHLACAEEDSPHNAEQLGRWQHARGALPHARAALANSAGITLGAPYHGDLTRPGLALYGGIPCSALAGTIAQVARPEAALLQVRDIAAGERVGYNGRFTATEAMRIGVAGIGYADGYLRAWSGKGLFRHGERALPAIGTVSMDMTVLDLRAAPDLKEGDWVAADYDLPAASAATGLTQYELLTVLGGRFARR